MHRYLCIKSLTHSFKLLWSIHQYYYIGAVGMMFGSLVVVANDTVEGAQG